MHLITTLTKSNFELRNKEYIECFDRNNSNKYIKSSTVLSEDVKVRSLFINTKTKLTHTQSRPNFRTIVDYANSNLNPGRTVIITNADIYYDNTLKHINFNNDYAYCLTRWHKYTEEGDWEHAKLGACHDTWILQTPIILDNIDFGMGILGCDSRFTYQCAEAGYKIINPSFLIKCYHLHVSNIRTWRRQDILCGNYAGIDPTYKIEYLKNKTFYFNGKVVNGKYSATDYNYNYFKEDL